MTNPVITRQCAWKLEDGSRCPTAAKPRAGTRGPLPRHCQVHTISRKREINHNPATPRSSRPECCQSGVCPQHADAREANRDLNEWWFYTQTERAKREATYLLELFDHAVSISIPRNPRGWRSDEGPDEGRTEPHVFNADPRGSDWYAGNPYWQDSEYEVWPPDYDGPDIGAWLDWAELPQAEREQITAKANALRAERLEKSLQ